jgi:hypothetical protein
VKGLKAGVCNATSRKSAYTFESWVGAVQPPAWPQLQHGLAVFSESSDSRLGQNCR